MRGKIKDYYSLSQIYSIILTLYIDFRIAVMSRLPMNVFGLETYKNLQDVLRKTKTTDQLTFSF